MNKITGLIITFGIIIFILLIILFFINRLFLKKNKVDYSFKNVAKSLEEREKIITNIIDFLEKNMEQEKKYIMNLKKSKELLKKINNSNKENLKEIKKSSILLEKFTSLSNIYTKINNNQIYNSLVEEINLNENRFNYSIESYNKEAKIYNNFKHTKINRILSKLFKIRDYEYYNK